MNREIKFRGKTIPFSEVEKDGSTYTYEGEMVFGYYHKTYADEHFIIKNSKTGLMLPGSKVNPESVGQFTGLTDPNGVEIFEGDILHYGNYTGSSEIAGMPCNHVVTWDSEHGAFETISLNKKDESNGSFLDDSGVVIGNVFENPELLQDVEHCL